MITEEEYKKAKSIVKDYEIQEVNRKELESRTIDLGHGMCKEKNCKNYAKVDYNGHNHWVCEYHSDKLEREFDEEYR